MKFFYEYGRVIITFILVGIFCAVVWHFFCLSFAKNTHNMANNVVTLFEEVQEEREAKITEALDAGYEVYVDGVQITDMDAINTKTRTYAVTIDDEKKIIYFEKQNNSLR